MDVHGLTKRFGSKTVVDGLDMRVEEGQIYGFLGPNGSGKTTSIRMLCGLLTPDAGEGTCLGLDLRTQAQQIKRQTGYMTQRFSWYEDLSIAENLNFAARLYGVPDVRARVDQTLQRLGLQDRRQQLAGTLSGGWKQRLALAASMMHKPRLLLLDEPTAGVDPKARRDFWSHIHALAAEGMTVLVSTHYMDEAERCHRLAYIAYGKLLIEGTPESVLQQVGLSTWLIEGAGAADLAALEQLPGVQQAVPFGGNLHLSGTDGERLQASVQGYCEPRQLRFQRRAASLEDAFIHLMGRSRDNFAGSTDAGASA
ncbi:MAG: ABC transporter ATP-binding protein [Xanthomonadales bacterium]|nr:ABC transporter ATP-binding protein [Xanthomonadales bacterium]